MKRSRWPALSGVLAAVIAISGAAVGAGSAAAAAPQTCQINSPVGNVSHVVYLQFDNTHYNRDNPSVTSDLEQMPHLLNFLT